MNVFACDKCESILPNNKGFWFNLTTSTLNEHQSPFRKPKGVKTVQATLCNICYDLYVKDLPLVDVESKE